MMTDLSFVGWTPPKLWEGIGGSKRFGGFGDGCGAGTGQAANRPINLWADRDLRACPREGKSGVAGAHPEEVRGLFQAPDPTVAFLALFHPEGRKLTIVGPQV